MALVPQRESSWKIRQSHHCQEEKEQYRQSRVPDRDGGESQGEQAPHLDEKEGNLRESMERKGWTPRMKEDRFQGRKEGQARKASLEEVEGHVSG